MELSRFTHHSIYAIQQDLNIIMKASNLAQAGYTYLEPRESYPCYTKWFNDSGYPLGDPLTLGEGNNQDHMFQTLPPHGSQQQPSVDFAS